MKRISMIAALASVAAIATVSFSAPVMAEEMCGTSVCAVVHNRVVTRPVANNQSSHPSQTTATGVPEPGMIPLLALGLGGVGFLALRRRRAQV